MVKWGEKRVWIFIFWLISVCVWLAALFMVDNHYHGLQTSDPEDDLQAPKEVSPRAVLTALSNGLISATRCSTYVFSCVDVIVEALRNRGGNIVKSVVEAKLKIGLDPLEMLEREKKKDELGRTLEKLKAEAKG